MVSEPVRIRMLRGGSFENAMLDDLSAGGACVRSHARLKAGDQVALSMKLGPGQLFEVLGRIVYSRPDTSGFFARYGLRFVQLDEDTEQRLAAYVAHEKFGRLYGVRAFSSEIKPA